MALPNSSRSVLARLLRIWSTLLSGSVVAQLLSLAAFAIAARDLPLELLGGIAVIQGTARLIDGLINIRSGVPLTTYAARFLAEDDAPGLMGLLKAGFFLDAVTATLAAIATALVLMTFAGEIGIPAELVDAAPFYALMVLVSVPGLHLAVLRSFDRYGAIAVSEVAGAALRLVAFFLAGALDAEPVWYLVIWLSSDIIVQILPLGLALRVLRQRGYPGVFTGNAREALAKLPGFWRMIWTTNLTTSVRSLSEQGDVVLLGWLAGPAAAGVLRIAKAIASPVIQLGTPIQQAAFPEVARLRAEGDFRGFARNGLLYCAVGTALGFFCFMGAWLFGPLVVQAVTGAENEDVALVLMLLVATHALYLIGVVLTPMASALEQMGCMLGATTLAGAIFAVSAPILIMEWQALGASLALFAHNLVWLCVAANCVRHKLIAAGHALPRSC